MRAVVLAAALLAGGTALAQEQEPRARRGPEAGPEHVFKMVDEYFVRNLKARLDLTDEQLARVLPPVRKLQNDRRALTRRRFRAMSELRRSLASGGATEGGIEALLREVKAVEAEESSTLRRDREAVDGALTPLQQAKFRVLEAEVERRVRHALARQGRGGRPHPRNRDAPPPD
jgi:Spy/CpxP family protein refolding chaperone